MNTASSRTFEIKIPSVLKWIAWVVSVLVLIALILIVFVTPIQKMVGMTPEFSRGFVTGAAVMLGCLILISDRVSIAIVRQRNIGWAFLVLGFYLAFWKSLFPIARAIWDQLTPAQVTFSVIAVVLIAVGFFIVRRQIKRRSP